MSLYLSSKNVPCYTSTLTPPFIFPLSLATSLGLSYLGVMRNAKGVMSDVALWLTPDSLAGLPP